MYDELLAARERDRPTHNMGALELFLRSLVPGFAPTVGAPQAVPAAVAAPNFRRQLGAVIAELGLQNLLQAVNAEPGQEHEASDEEWEID